MKQHRLAVRCAWCDKARQRAFAPGDQDQEPPPVNGDTMLCIGCGQISMFDRSAQTGTRRPTPYERGELSRDPFIARMKMAWRQASRPGRIQ